MQWSSCRKVMTRSGTGLVAAALTAGLLINGGASALAGGSAWTIEKSPNQMLADGKLEAVSCSSADACTAVGTYLKPSGLKATLAERWNGRTWQRQFPRNPAQDTVASVAPDLLGVSCPAANFCLAVGTYQLGFGGVAMAQAWNGRRWTSQRFPVPPGSFGASLNQVSCTSARFCEAVGSFESLVGTVSLAAMWNGNSWRLQRAPDPAGDRSAALSTVSCASPHFCEAWGAGNGGNPGPTIAERWNGRSWHLQSLPTTSTTAIINSVSCTSTRFCEAVGFGQALNSAVGFRWNGSRWTAQKIPRSIGTFFSASCTSATFCEAVGFSFPSQIAARWNGKAWTTQSVPSPAGATSSGLNAVACASAASCEAVGDFVVAGNFNHQSLVAEAWNGHAWLIQHAVAPAGATDNRLFAVSCVSATFCEAVGTFTDAAGSGAGLAEMWNGSSWHIQALPAGAGTGAVSCVSAQFCEAVGPGAATQWNGTSWTAQSLPGADVEPISVSCVSADFCMSVNGFAQVAMWNGSSWSAGPAVTGFSFGGSVSCSSATFCEAVGEGPSGDNAAVWNGTSWTDQPTPGPVSSFLSAVSCPAANACEAVGSFANSAFQEATFAEVWNGTTWAIQPIPNPSISQDSALLSVWCTSATSCTAVGDYQYNGAGNSHTLAEVWDGTAWHLRSTPSKINAGQNILSGVSCGAAGNCTAVGQTRDIGQIPATLIEAGD